MFGPKNRTTVKGLAYRSGLTRRKSRSSTMCLYLGLFAAALFISSITALRFDYMEPQRFFWMSGIACVCAFFSICYAVPALRDFFVEDALGVGHVVRGLLWASVVAGPLIYLGAQAIRYPKINDLSTSIDSPPEFDAILKLRQNTAFPNGNLSDETLALQQAAYPHLGPHRYATNAHRVALSVNKVIEKRKWKIIDGPDLSKKPDDAGAIEAEAEVEIQDDKIVPIPLSREQAAAQLEQTLERLDQPVIGETLRFEVVSSSLITNFDTDIVFELKEVGRDTLVNMRVATRHIAHDFGANSRLISSFLKELNGELLGVAGEQATTE